MFKILSDELFLSFELTSVSSPNSARYKTSFESPNAEFPEDYPGWDIFNFAGIQPPSTGENRDRELNSLDWAILDEEASDGTQSIKTPDLSSKNTRYIASVEFHARDAGIERNTFGWLTFHLKTENFNGADLNVFLDDDPEDIIYSFDSNEGWLSYSFCVNSNDIVIWDYVHPPGTSGVGFMDEVCFVQAACTHGDTSIVNACSRI